MGPIVRVHIGPDTRFVRDLEGMPQAQNVPALVDTGADKSYLDSDLAKELNLPCVEQREIAGAGGLETVDVFLAQISVPDLGEVIYGKFAGVNLAQGGSPYKAVLGRSFLSRCVMIYDGPGNRVTLLI